MPQQIQSQTSNPIQMNQIIQLTSVNSQTSKMELEASGGLRDAAEEIEEEEKRMEEDIKEFGSQTVSFTRIKLMNNILGEGGEELSLLPHKLGINFFFFFFLQTTFF